MRRYKAKPIVFFTLLGLIAFSLLSTEAFAQSSITWDKSTYKICDVGRIIIEAPEENTDPNLI